eukprot:TRINITY_DN63650_c0_g1_i1.p1 TRINITY_DN63650_c0_g1~~TRINITY_DN63650_c0_g1_i1.p1  ORF type:complete len:296 (+),score=45.53 TRINITY_DN63650_c0_g1_i1:103-990(+)
MSCRDEQTAESLDRYFERRLTCKGDTLMCEPKGYRLERSKICHSEEHFLLRHHATGIGILADPLDLVVRTDFRHPSEETCVVYCYIADCDSFVRVAKLARARPQGAFESLIEDGILQVSSVNEGEEWYAGPLTPVEPACIASREMSGDTLRNDVPWRNTEFGIALFVLARHRRVLSSQDHLEVQMPGREGLQVDKGMHLIEAARRSDPEEVQRCLELRADPNFADARGWTALHIAVHFKRPNWSVLDQLLEVCDVCQRTLGGELPVELADGCANHEVAEALRAKMATHKKGKHLL